MSKNVELIGLSAKEAACVATSISFAMSKGAGNTPMAASLHKVMHEIHKSFCINDLSIELDKIQVKEKERVNKKHQKISRNSKIALDTEQAADEDAESEDKSRMCGFVMPKSDWLMVLICLGRWFCEMKGEEVIPFESEKQKETLVNAMGTFLEKIHATIDVEDDSNADSSNAKQEKN